MISAKISVKNMLFVALAAFQLQACTAADGQKNISHETVDIKPNQTEVTSIKPIKKDQAGVQTSLTEEPLYGKTYRDGKLSIQVRTFGCTNAQSFRLSPSAEQPGWLTVWRTKPDYCRRAPMITTVVLTLPGPLREELRTKGLESPLRLTNVEVPTAGLPVIPSVGNP